MDTKKKLKVNLENMNFVADGIYSNLLCPECGQKKAEAFFSKHKSEKLYGVWFECHKCGNVEHISCGKKPDGFKAERISEKYQVLDERAWEFAGQ